MTQNLVKFSALTLLSALPLLAGRCFALSCFACGGTTLEHELNN